MGVTVIARTLITPKAASAFAENMEKALVETRQYDGCISVDGFRDQDDPTNIIAIERWESRDKYLAYVAWRKSTGMLDRIAGILQEPMHATFFDQITSERS